MAITRNTTSSPLSASVRSTATSRSGGRSGGLLGLPDPSSIAAPTTQAGSVPDGIMWPVGAIAPSTSGAAARTSSWVVSPGHHHSRGRSTCRTSGDKNSRSSAVPSRITTACGESRADVLQGAAKKPRVGQLVASRREGDHFCRGSVNRPRVGPGDQYDVGAAINESANVRAFDSSGCSIGVETRTQEHEWSHDRPIHHEMRSIRSRHRRSGSRVAALRGDCVPIVVARRQSVSASTRACD